MPTTVTTVKLLWWHRGTRFVLFGLFLLLTINRIIQKGEECLVRYSISQSYRRSAAVGGGRVLPQPKHNAAPAASGPPSSLELQPKHYAAPAASGPPSSSEPQPKRKATPAASGPPSSSELQLKHNAAPAASGPPSSSEKQAAPQPKRKTEHAASSAPNSATDCHCTTKCVGRCINAPLPHGATRIKKPRQHSDE